MQWHLIIWSFSSLRSVKADPCATWVRHAPANCGQVFPFPLLHFFLHLVDFGGVEGPQAAFAGSTAQLVLHLLKAFVQG